MLVRANVRRYFLLLFAWIFALPVTHAAVCDPKTFHGAYGLSLTGTTTIGGPKRPVAVVGRLVLDDSGNLSGISSTSFTGLILGNPVTGKYEAHFDCSVTWSLQDDSGNFQHFAGTMSADDGHVDVPADRSGRRRERHSAPDHGWVFRIQPGGDIQLTASGRTVDVNTAVDSGRVSVRGVVIADGTGNLYFASGPDEPALGVGSYEVQDDCFVKLVMELPADGNQAAAMHFRAIVVDNGREVLGIQTDPGTVVALRLVSK